MRQSNSPSAQISEAKVNIYLFKELIMTLNHMLWYLSLNASYLTMLSPFLSCKMQAEKDAFLLNILP
jgi:hypothetical protein